MGVLRIIDPEAQFKTFIAKLLVMGFFPWKKWPSKFFLNIKQNELNFLVITSWLCPKTSTIFLFHLNSMTFIFPFGEGFREFG
jgi:hypothetical protein